MEKIANSYLTHTFFCHPLDFFRIDDIIINEFTVLKSCRLSKMREIRFESGATAITVFDSKRRRKRSYDAFILFASPQNHESEILRIFTFGFSYFGVRG